MLAWADENDTIEPYLRSMSVQNGADESGVDGGEPSPWWYGNQWSELPPGSGISTRAARAAVREFVHTRARPASVRWTDS